MSTWIDLCAPFDALLLQHQEALQTLCEHALGQGVPHDELLAFVVEGTGWRRMLSRAEAFEHVESGILSVFRRSRFEGVPLVDQPVFRLGAPPVGQFSVFVVDAGHALERHVTMVDGVLQ
jgi:hypothetical protein